MGKWKIADNRPNRQIHLLTSKNKWNAFLCWCQKFCGSAALKHKQATCVGYGLGLCLKGIVHPELICFCFFTQQFVVLAIFFSTPQNHSGVLNKTQYKKKHTTEEKHILFPYCLFGVMKGSRRHGSQIRLTRERCQNIHCSLVANAQWIVAHIRCKNATQLPMFTCSQRLQHSSMSCLYTVATLQHIKKKKMSENFSIEEECSLWCIPADIGPAMCTCLQRRGYSGYFGWKHGVNIAASCQIGTARSYGRLDDTAWAVHFMAMYVFLLLFSSLFFYVGVCGSCRQALSVILSISETQEWLHEFD